MDKMNPGATIATARGADPLTRWIRTVMWGAILVPLASFVVLAAWGYQRTVADARTKVAHASALSLRQASRILDNATKVAAIADAATRASDDDVRTNEQQIQRRLADLCTGLGFVVNMNVWAADGRPLVRSDTYPVAGLASIADRRYFIDQATGSGAPGISEVLSGRSSGRELFNLTIRRQPLAGRFNGIITVSLSPEFFRDYYRSLASDEPDLASFALVRTDGTILARWPVVAPVHTTVDADNVVFRQLSAGAFDGIDVVPEREGRESRLISFHRVPGWPVYVTAGVSNASVVTGWLRFTMLLFAVLLPIAAGLVWISWIALRKTREEQRNAETMRQEIQRRAQAEKQVIEVQKLQTLAQLTGGVAHDFNNLLTIISNNLYILGKRRPELATDKHLPSALRAVQSGVRLTRQLLSFSRKQALRPEVVDLRTWLRETEALVRSTLGSRVSLHYEVAADTYPVRVDLAELELALINTALNAQHAMPGGGTLRVTAHNAVALQGEPMVVVCVEDSGEGIAPDLLAKVLEPFFTTKAAGKGSGLGLSQVAGLCEQSGGFVRIDSELGRGTRVAMHFPAVTGLDEPVAAPTDDVTPMLHGRVLLVEDNPEVATVTEQLLRTLGLDVHWAPDADTALAQLAREADAFDVVLSDILMPGALDGIELARTVRRGWPTLPVLLTTGYAEKIHEAVAEGFRVIAKPVHPDALVKEIGALVGVSATMVV